MSTRCPACDFNNREENAFCAWCGSQMTKTVIAVPQLLTTVRTPGPRVWLPRYIYAHDPSLGYYPALEWQQYEIQ